MFDGNRACILEMRRRPEVERRLRSGVETLTYFDGLSGFIPRNNKSLIPPHPHMPGADSPQIVDDLLKRFHALRAPVAEPTEPAPVSEVDKAARDAERETAELDAIAEGRAFRSSKSRAAGPGGEEDDELSRRMYQLRGGRAYDVEEDRDDEVSARDVGS